MSYEVRDDSEIYDPSGERKMIVFMKEGRRIAFDCMPGEERSVVEDAKEMANSEGSRLDYFDVAVLAQQLGVRID
jgi:hypothetical protein